MLSLYNPCITNKVIRGNQCMVTWHAGNLKISPVDPLAMDELIDRMDNEFGKNVPLLKLRGKIHDYFRRVLDSRFLVKRQIKWKNTSMGSS